MHYLALALVSSITLSATVLAVKQGLPVKISLNDQKSAQNIQNPNAQKLTESVFSTLKKPLYFEPTEITLNAKTLKIEEIGLKPSGELDAPLNWQNAGWYKRGAKVGEEGNLIIDGHYDDSSGNPAAFWGLKSLQVGDKVVIRDRLNRLFSYEVTEVFYVDSVSSDPKILNEIFEDQNKPHLTLITCGGVFNPAMQTYDKRLVVKAELLVSQALLQ